MKMILRKFKHPWRATVKPKIGNTIVGNELHKHEKRERERERY